MGIPYSKQINHAFDQVTPLVAEGFQVLEKTKNIALILLWLEILSAIIIGFNLVCLVAILITLNPDLEEERRALVDPAVKWVASETRAVADVLGSRWLSWGLGLGFVALGVGYFGMVGWLWVDARRLRGEVEEGEDGDGEDGQDGDKGTVKKEAGKKKNGDKNTNNKKSSKQDKNEDKEETE